MMGEEVLLAPTTAPPHGVVTVPLPSLAEDGEVTVTLQAGPPGPGKPPRLRLRAIGLAP
jgi:hypothetical protein